MCGVNAIFAYHRDAPAVDRAELRVVRDHMARRGPDDEGEWYDKSGRVGLAHRRLSIIDLSADGAQPMSTADKTLVIVYNGEIYNYQQLRTQLEARGRAFRSRSDTEVLLHLYAEEGERMFDELRGMYAFALWDAREGVLLLARDPYGIKPLYYADDGRTVRAASQVKALRAGGRISRVRDPAGVAGYFLFGCVPEPHTTFREIRAVPAGGIVWVDRNGPREPRRLFSISRVFCDASASVERLDAPQLQHRVRSALRESVEHHMVADVPVGAFLSAGVDSGTLVGLMTAAGTDEVQTVTLAFREYRGTSENEAPLAERVARRYGARHSTRVVDETEFRRDMPRILEAMDQPSIDGVNTWFASKAAHEVGLKVAVSGLGGDELFGGYPSFSQIPRLVRVLGPLSAVPWLGELFRRTTAPLLSSTSLSPKLAGLLRYGGSYPGAYLLRRGVFMPWELGDVMPADEATEGLRRLEPLHHVAAALSPDPSLPFARVAALEASLYMRNQLLRDMDWASMAHSVEVRTPLVDARLLQALAPALCGQTRIRAKLLLGRSPTPPVPSEVLERPKTGFGVPLAGWLKRMQADDELLDAWRSVPALARSGCPWSRRLAFALSRPFLD